VFDEERWPFCLRIAEMRRLGLLGCVVWLCDGEVERVSVKNTRGAQRLFGVAQQSSCLHRRNLNSALKREGEMKGNPTRKVGVF